MLFIGNHWASGFYSYALYSWKFHSWHQRSLWYSVLSCINPLQVNVWGTNDPYWGYQQFSVARILEDWYLASGPGGLYSINCKLVSLQNVAFWGLLMCRTGQLSSRFLMCKSFSNMLCKIFLYLWYWACETILDVMQKIDVSSLFLPDVNAMTRQRNFGGKVIWSRTILL